MTLTNRSVALLAGIALSALVLPWQISVVAMIAVGLAATTDAVAVRQPPDVRRSHPDILSRGVPAPFTAAAMGRITSIRLRQPTPADITVEPAEADDALFGTIVAHRRGAHRLEGIATKSIGPLGLGGWYHRVGSVRTITVYPDMHAAQRLALAVRTGRFRDEGHRAKGPLGLGTDFESIREYNPDDDIRQLNVRATARTGTPMTNRYRVEQDRDVICLIDCGRLMRAPIADMTRLDAAVDAAAAVAAVADEVGDRVGVIAFRNGIIRNIRPARDNGVAVASAIHDLEPTAVESDYRLALQLVSTMKRAFVLVLTDLMDEAAAAPLSEMVQLVSRKHSLAVAGVRDDEIWSLLSTPATHQVEALQTAVAADLMSETQRLGAVLTSRGATVIEAPVDQLSHRCVSAYLRAKNRARI